MNHSSNNGFIHSIKVPRIYKTAALILKKVIEEGSSLKDLIYSSNHKNIKGTYALVVKTIQHNQELDKLLKKSKILQKESRLQPWLAKVLITELFYGKGDLKGESKPIQTILAYRNIIEKLLKNEKNVDTVMNFKKNKFEEQGEKSFKSDQNNYHCLDPCGFKEIFKSKI